MEVVRRSGLPRYELEDAWRERVTEALKKYRTAKLEANSAMVQNRNGELPPADGNFAYRRALQTENIALAEYKRVLVIFNDFVLDGKIPPDA